ncbi:hypothetical protein [Thiocapsa sp.]|uniref:hypothetical protein n=1 Tax=Thiocapsa sp. TaxID=2024551 RepID=UPI0035939F55
MLGVPKNVSFDDQDRLADIDWLRKAPVREHSRLYAEAPMINYPHLLLTTEHAERLQQVLISVGSRDLPSITTATGAPALVWLND